MLKTINGRFRRRFQLLSWPLALFETSKELRNEDLPLRAEAKRTRYPFRALRYWWVVNAMNDEVRRLGRGLTVVDVGTDRGLLKLIAPPIPGARWIGVDRDFSNEPVQRAKYDELHECDLESAIPLPDSCADIVVCLHTMEHMRRPEVTFAELRRIVKPGGILLLGSPVLPRPLAALRAWQFRRELASGQRKPGQHVVVLHRGLWRRLIRQGNLNVELFTGSHMLRSTGSPLENLRGWVRLNQFLAACIPSLGNELCLQLRAPAASGSPLRASRAAQTG